MGYKYTKRNGKRVEVHVAAAFDKMAAAFKKKFGLELRVTSGTRTRAEQQRLYNGWIKRLPGYNLAARPGTSNHEETGPRGPRALDLHDTGSDAGVTVIGSRRSNWLAANAPKYGFKNAGHYFNPREGWHYEYQWSLSGSTGSSASSTVKSRQSFLNSKRGERLVVDGINGSKTKEAIKRYQKFLKGSYGYTGAIDGVWGSGTQRAHNKYKSKSSSSSSSSSVLRKGSRGSGVKKLQTILKKNYPLYAGTLKVDGVFGNATLAAVKEFQRRSGITVDGVVGPNTKKKLHW